MLDFLSQASVLPSDVMTEYCSGSHAGFALFPASILSSTSFPVLLRVPYWIYLSQPGAVGGSFGPIQEGMTFPPSTTLPVMGEIAGVNKASLGGYLHSSKTRARWAEGFLDGLNGHVFDLERDELRWVVLRP